MIELVQAPSEDKFKGVKIFIAGGISNCPKWQDELVEKLSNEPKLLKFKKKNIVIFNPRCKEIPEEEAQIKWEYKRLKKSDIISFWFSEGSLNPITLFEYGKHFKSKDKKIVVGCHPDYERRNNVITQTKLENPKLKVNENFDDFYNEIVNTLVKKLKK